MRKERQSELKEKNIKKLTRVNTIDLNLATSVHRSHSSLSDAKATRLSRINLAKLSRQESESAIGSQIKTKAVEATKKFLDSIYQSSHRSKL